MKWLGIVAASLVCSAAMGQETAVVFSGAVVDLQGNPRIGVPVVAQVLFQNDKRPFDAFDRSNADISSGRELVYDPDTARFFLPIRVADIPAIDAGVSLRFRISGQLISEVRFLSALKSLELDVVVPDPVPVPRYMPCQPRWRVRHCAPLAAMPLMVTPKRAKPRESEFRQWTDKSGTKSRIAKLVSIEGDAARFIRENGDPCACAIASLKPADQLFVKRWADDVKPANMVSR